MTGSVIKVLFWIVGVGVVIVGGVSGIALYEAANVTTEDIVDGTIRGIDIDGPLDGSQIDVNSDLAVNDFEASGDVIVEGNLDVFKRTTTDSLVVDSATTLNGVIMNSNGALLFSDDISVTGAVMFDKSLRVGGTSLFLETSTFGEDVLIRDRFLNDTGDLLANDNLVVSGFLKVVGDGTFENNLDVFGEIKDTSNGAVTIADALDILGDTHVVGETHLMGNLEVDGESLHHALETYEDDIDAQLRILNTLAPLLLDDDVTISGDAELQAELDVALAALLQDTLQVLGDTNLDGELDVALDARLAQALEVLGVSDLQGGIQDSVDDEVDIDDATLQVALDTLLNQDLVVLGTSDFQDHLFNSSGASSGQVFVKDDEGFIVTDAGGTERFEVDTALSKVFVDMDEFTVKNDTSAILKVDTNGTPFVKIRDEASNVIVDVNANVGGGGPYVEIDTLLSALQDIDLGDGSVDTLTILAEIDSHLVPDADTTYDLGALGSRWNELWTDAIRDDNALLGAFAGAPIIGAGALDLMDDVAIAGQLQILGLGLDLHGANPQIVDSSVATTGLPPAALGTGGVDINDDLFVTGGVTVHGEIVLDNQAHVAGGAFPFTPGAGFTGLEILDDAVIAGGLEVIGQTRHDGLTTELVGMDLVGVTPIGDDHTKGAAFPLVPSNAVEIDDDVLVQGALETTLDALFNSNLVVLPTGDVDVQGGAGIADSTGATTGNPPVGPGTGALDVFDDLFIQGGLTVNGASLHAALETFQTGITVLPAAPADIQGGIQDTTDNQVDIDDALDVLLGATFQQGVVVLPAQPADVHSSIVNTSGNNGGVVLINDLLDVVGALDAQNQIFSSAGLLVLDDQIDARGSISNTTATNGGDVHINDGFAVTGLADFQNGVDVSSGTLNVQGDIENLNGTDKVTVSDSNGFTIDDDGGTVVMNVDVAGTSVTFDGGYTFQGGAASFTEVDTSSGGLVNTFAGRVEADNGLTLDTAGVLDVRVNIEDGGDSTVTINDGLAVIGDVDVQGTNKLVNTTGTLTLDDTTVEVQAASTTEFTVAAGMVTVANLLDVDGGVSVDGGNLDVLGANKIVNTTGTLTLDDVTILLQSGGVTELTIANNKVTVDHALDVLGFASFTNGVTVDTSGTLNVEVDIEAQDDNVVNVSDELTVAGDHVAVGTGAGTSLVQGGTGTCGATGVPATITFSTAFSAAPNVVANDTTAAAPVPVQITNVTSTGFDCETPDAATQTVQYVAVGLE